MIFGFLSSLASTAATSQMTSVPAPVPASASDTNEAAKPRPIGPFPLSEYPLEAIRLHQQGKVVMTLSVNATGRVTGCEIAASSGSPSIDKASCAELRQVRFAPATDVNGNAIDGSVTMPMTWRLPTR